MPFCEAWKKIINNQGEEFTQIRGQVFTYKIKGDYLTPSTTEFDIPKKHFEEAWEQHMPLKNTMPVQHLYGPSYLFAILTDPRIKN